MSELSAVQIEAIARAEKTTREILDLMEKNGINSMAEIGMVMGALLGSLAAASEDPDALLNTVALIAQGVINGNLLGPEA